MSEAYLIHNGTSILSLQLQIPERFASTPREQRREDPKSAGALGGVLAGEVGGRLTQRLRMPAAAHETTHATAATTERNINAATAQPNGPQASIRSERAPRIPPITTRTVLVASAIRRASEVRGRISNRASAWSSSDPPRSANSDPLSARRNSLASHCIPRPYSGAAPQDKADLMRTAEAAGAERSGHGLPERPCLPNRANMQVR